MKRILFLSFFISIAIAGMSQKPPLDFSVYDQWNRMGSYQISQDGKFVSFEINPSVGDGKLFFKKVADGSEKSWARAKSAQISPESGFMAFKIVPQHDSVRKEKLDKVKGDKKAKDSLGIYIISKDEILLFPKLKSFRLPAEKGSWMAFLTEEMKAEEPKDSTGTEKKKKEKEKKKKYGGADLHILNPVSGKSFELADVCEYRFSRNGDLLAYIQIKEDSVNTTTAGLFNTQTEEFIQLFQNEGISKKLSFDKNGEQLVFLNSQDTLKNKVFSLYHWKLKEKKAECIIDTLSAGIPDSYCLSEYGNLMFSENGEKLFFGTAPKPENKEEKKDSLLAEEIVNLDIWHYQDVLLQTQQLKGVNRERTKNYLAVYHFNKKKIVQLADEEFESVRLSSDRNADIALVYFEKPYELSNSVNFESFYDIYIQDLKTGEREKIFEKVYYRPSFSVDAKYLRWFDARKNNWYAYNVKKKSVVNMTEALDVVFYDEKHDYPSDPREYGFMGWSDNEEYVYVYDSHDIWRLDPDGEDAPVNITRGYGKQNHIRFRYFNYDAEQRFVNPEAEWMLSAVNTENMMSGLYTCTNGELSKIVMGPYRYGRPKKAKEAETILFTRQSPEEYGDLWISDTYMSNPQKLSNANPQQMDYNWYTAELFEWMDFNGDSVKGLLYKPENFDPSKKYPVMVYFYRTHSESLYSHSVPRASSSIINPAFYASNGYLVFMPDIKFEVGHPGRSAFNAVTSGAMALADLPYVDKDHMGLQGQSWGGYSVAFIITQTNLFAAASPGAPVSNMTSAYGGIRLESGMCRQTQYEKGQSRIGGTLWEKPLEYFENSPLFYADQVTTPCLIRHNDLDGAVPFAQGVEFFVALRRLGKPAWLLNYNKGPHNLTKKLSNRKDLSVRMKQFFDHFLKGEEMPEWLEKGVPAVNKDENKTFYLKHVKQ